MSDEDLGDGGTAGDDRAAGQGYWCELAWLPPGQVAVPLKIVLFVLADGWWLLADGLLKTFEIGASSG